jgi:hypothetical protein
MAKKTTTGPKKSVMSQSLLKQRTEDAVKVAQQHLMTAGYVAPVLLIFGEETAIILGFADPGAMNQIPVIVKRYEAEAEAFILVNEGWVKGPTNTYRIGEAINVCAKSRTGNYGAVCIFSRDVNNKPVFDKTMYSSQVYCRHLDGVF